MLRTLKAWAEPQPLAEPFHIAGRTFTDMPVVVVRLRDGDAVGWGEASGVYYLDDDPPAMLRAIENVREAIEAGIHRRGLQLLLPPGGARNALDCALWDLEAKQTGRPVWQLAGLPSPTPLTTMFTVGADAPNIMAAKGEGYRGARALKLKLTGEPDLDAERVRAVRSGRPDVWLAVDANQGFTPRSLEQLMPDLLAADVKLLEQPFARGREADLDDIESPIPIAGDESLLSFADVQTAVGRFDVFNIKLDKCGGLTEALAIAYEARRLGLDLMVGNMGGTSLAMSAGFLLGQLCSIVDLDGPLFLREDRTPSATYAHGRIDCAGTGWGAAA